MNQKINQPNIKYANLLLVGCLLFAGACQAIAQDPLPRTLVKSTVESAIETAKEPKIAGQMLPITAQANIKGTVIDLEVAATRQQQAMGLMFRPELPGNRGMLFPFAQARIARFWMKDVPVALDMVFLRNGKVIAIADSAPPCDTKPEDCPLYGPNTFVDSVIELRAGRARELALQVGDLVRIEHLPDS